MAATGLRMLAPESVTSGRLALPVAEPEEEAERVRVAEVTVELTPAEGLMVAEAEAALVIMLDLALSMALLRAAEAEVAADAVADEAEAMAEETAEETGESSSSAPPERGNWAE